jgi:hypothetical protein
MMQVLIEFHGAFSVFQGMISFHSASEDGIFAFAGGQ